MSETLRTSGFGFLSDFGFRISDFRFSRSSQRGVALVITLILLVVITTLAVAFLALSTRETAAVGGSGNTLVSEYAADAALERANAQILAQIRANNSNGAPNNTMGPEFMVSVCVETNRAPSQKFPNGSLRTFINPSPPVFIWTNKAINNFSAVEDRFWVDLDRNLQFEPTGYIPDVDNSGVPIVVNGNPIIQWRVGDPQWIGLLRDPTQPHGPDNPFIARYAYLILPAGRSLDLNWIYNQAVQTQVFGRDGYFRNQGVGCWELNLAAFLADLNPHYWNTNRYGEYSYAYSWDPNMQRGAGAAFADALELLAYRFPSLGQSGNRYASFRSCRTHFSQVALDFVRFDSVDLFCDGPVATPYGRSDLTAGLPDFETADRWWVGSAGAASFYTIHDLWTVPAVLERGPPNTPSQVKSGFFTRLKDACSQVNSDDRYTYYRLLAQLSTDSVPERDDRLNINYRNITNDIVTPTNYSRSALATNVVPWTATEFFHAAVDRLLTNEFFPYGITNVRLSGLDGGAGIPVFTNGSLFIDGNSNKPPIYNSRIQQLLQMTLNIYEASRSNDVNVLTTNLPTVLRPLFEKQPNGDIYITRYEDLTYVNLKALISPPGGTYRWYELGDAAAPVGPKGSPSPNVNFYDIPILFGARKGLPNFNEFTMNTVAHFSRKLQVERDSSLQNIIATNQMLIMSVSNFFICEFWNSYSNYANGAYPRQVEFSVGVVSTSLLTNNNFRGFSTNGDGDSGVYAPLSWASNAYRLTKVLTNTTLPQSIYYNYAPNGPGFKLFDQNVSANNIFEKVGAASTNHWGLSVSNRVLCFLYDNNRLIDCYASARMNSYIDLSAELDTNPEEFSGFGRMWHPRDGIGNQIRTSRGPVGNNSAWVDYTGLPSFSTVKASYEGFEAWMSGTTVTQRVIQAGFSPNVRILQVNSWEANDPLVHYTVYDLFGGTGYSGGYSNTAITRVTPGITNSIYKNDLTPVVSSPGSPLGNKRYSPWGGPQPAAGTPVDFRFAEKDPGVYVTDLYDFPLQKFPSLGWLGRVHRGTPWQTIFLKAPDPGYTLLDWAAHTGASYMPDTFPTNDWRLLDVFTAAIHPNATRGRLSINQTNPAAWSAVFSSVPVTGAFEDGSGAPPPFETNVQPISVDVPLAAIVENINLTRSNVFGGQFRKLSEFMMVTNLTIGSPYFANFDPGIKQSANFFMTDSDYERLPQQILSLVKLGEPRYVVYAWGQSLKPADFVPGIGIGVDAGTKLTRNYQITGELATRAVVRVEFEKNAAGQSVFNKPHAVVENFNILPNQ